MKTNNELIDLSDINIKSIDLSAEVDLNINGLETIEQIDTLMNNISVTSYD
jgi:poly(3-hydroxyalkanoate) synthetase